MFDVGCYIRSGHMRLLSTVGLLVGGTLHDENAVALDYLYLCMDVNSAYPTMP